MARTLGAILSVITAPLTLIDRDIGNAISGAVITAIGFATGNPALIALGLSRFSSAVSSSPKPPTTERAVKTPTPPRVYLYGKRKMFGYQMLYETSGDGEAVDVFAFLDGRANAVTAVYLNDELYTLSGGFITGGTDGAYGDNKVRVGYNLGLATETAFAPVVAELPGIWTTAHRGDGIVSAYIMKKPVKEKSFLKRYPQGDSVALSLTIEGQLCFDPREVGHDPDDDSTWAYTENAVLHLLHYYMVRRGYDYATRLEPVISYWIAAADNCDEAMALSAGGTEPRYRSCVSYDATKPHGDVIAELLTCFDGWTAPDENGCLLVYSGELYEPTVSIGPDEIVAYSHQSFVEDENVVNELVVQYVSAEHDYSTVEGTAWRDEADITARGKVNSDGFSPQVPSLTQARRLAKRSVLRRNAPNRGTVTTNFSGRAVTGQRYINLLIEESGSTFFDGVAEIVGLERDYDTGGVTFEWIEALAAMDEWNPATEDGTAAPVAEHVPPEVLADPVIISAIFFGTANSSDGVPGARIRATISGPDRDDLTWFARWRTVGAAVWGGDLEFSDVDPGASVVIETDFVPVNADVEIQVAYQLGDGRISEWSTAVTISTDTVTFDSDGITFDSISLTFDRG